MENLGKSREQSWRNHGKTIFGSKELPKKKNVEIGGFRVYSHIILTINGN